MWQQPNLKPSPSAPNSNTILVCLHISVLRRYQGMKQICRPNTFGLAAGDKVGWRTQSLRVRAGKQGWGSPDKCFPTCHFNLSLHCLSRKLRSLFLDQNLATQQTPLHPSRLSSSVTSPQKPPWSLQCQKYPHGAPTGLGADTRVEFPCPYATLDYRPLEGRPGSI